VALTAAWLGGYFDNRHEELAEQRGALLQDINNLKTDLKMLQGRELQYKQLILASESVLHGKEQQLVTEKSVLKVEIDQLLETKKALEQSADLKAEESRVVEDVLSSGGSIGITMREGRRQFLSGASVSPRSVSNLISTCPALNTVSFHSSSENLAGLLSNVPYHSVRHLEVSCRDGVDPIHLSSFDRLTSLHIASPLGKSEVWPPGFASHAKYIALPTFSAQWISQLIALRSVRVLSFGVPSEEAAAKLRDILPRFSELVELEIDCAYKPFPVSALSNMTRLKNLSINHAKLIGGECFAWGQTRDSGLVDRDFSIRVMRSSIFAFARLARFARRTKSPELSR